MGDDAADRAPWWRRQPQTVKAASLDALLLFVVMTLVFRYVLRQPWEEAASFSAVFFGVGLIRDSLRIRRRSRV